VVDGSSTLEFGKPLFQRAVFDLSGMSVWRLFGMNKTILKAIEYGLTAAGLLIGILFIVLIIRVG